MGKNIDLEQRIKELKLEKRELLLAGKNTDSIDKVIESLEEQLKEVNK